MTRYFLHLRDGFDDILDEEGVEYDTLEQLRSGVLACARDVLSNDMKRGVVDLRLRIDAENDSGEIVYSLHFKHAFSIIPAADD